MPWMRQKILSWGMGFFWYHIEISFTFPTIITIRPKKICVSDCMVFKIRVGRSWFFFFETYKYAPSSKIKQICLFLSYYNLLIIWQAVQCFWFQTSINVQGNEENSVNIATVKCLLLNSETNTDTETNFRILPIYFFLRVGRSETHILFGLNKTFTFNFVSSNNFVLPAIPEPAFLQTYSNNT